MLITLSQSVSEVSLTGVTSLGARDLICLAKLLLDDNVVKRLKWYGHVQRMGEKPKSTWINVIHKMMEEMRLTKKDLRDRR